MPSTARQGKVVVKGTRRRFIRVFLLPGALLGLGVHGWHGRHTVKPVRRHRMLQAMNLALLSWEVCDLSIRLHAMMQRITTYRHMAVREKERQRLLRMWPQVCPKRPTDGREEGSVWTFSTAT